MANGKLFNYDIQLYVSGEKVGVNVTCKVKENLIGSYTFFKNLVGFQITLYFLRFGYAVHILGNKDLIVHYDIACQLNAHLQVFCSSC